MENIAIQTSQNITIEQTAASVGERIVAGMIDLAIVLVMVLIVSLFGSVTQSPGLAVVMLLPLLFYHLASELVMDGQSWGKKIMKIKVVKIDGSRVEFVSYLIRWMFRLVDVLIFFGGISVLVIILNGKGQRFGDMAAHTTVIRLKEGDFGNESIFTEVPVNYVPVYPDVNKLCDQDIYTAKEVLAFISDSYSSGDSMDMASKAKAAFEAKMGVRSELSPEKFLKTVMLDYNYIHSR
ncbi:MAG: RDD family protein [Bacteroidales bacterium]|nr:RDD family protein [Bacteroidales bacterium]